MGSVRRRLEALERRRPLAKSPAIQPPVNGEDAKERWLADARMRRFDATYSRAEERVRDLLRLFRSQGNLADLRTTEDLRDRLLVWRPPLEARAVERVLARAIYDREEGLEGMVCPPEWSEAFEAAEELRERYMDASDEVDLAQLLVASHRLRSQEEEGDEEDKWASLEEWHTAERERLGITDELLREAVGPDSEEISQEEGNRRLHEILGDFFYGEKGYRVQQHITRLVNEGGA